jgi:D-tagatose-1,6-bisphosphate aldolase subunit GatZ/KbaZ
MDALSFIEEMISDQKRGEPRGIYSVCSSNSYVIEASLEQAQNDGSMALIESTSNQVNQLGGYTGMTPGAFRDYVYGVAEHCGFKKEHVILGGDHLGPNPFQKEDRESAMKKACDMVDAYVTAGFRKIHLDTSMPLGGDHRKDEGILDQRIVAGRCAELCAVSEDAFQERRKKTPQASPPFYVIGTEVPVPGGSDEVERGVKVTSADDFRATVSITKDAFFRRGLHEAWGRVIAVVVQPGVEFGDRSVIEYDRRKARHLKKAIAAFDTLVCEAHSTDYQTKGKLRQMVGDGFAILKVGPALTFALREAIFLLCRIEEELEEAGLIGSSSRFVSVVERVMCENPAHWETYYTGNERQKAFSRKYSLFDRFRYYLPEPEVQAAIGMLVQNLQNAKPPYTLLSQFVHAQYKKIREGALSEDPEAIMRDRIKTALADYSYAVGSGKIRG